VLNVRERRLADQKLKALTQRVLDTQEEERGRVARELHDSISQILVGVRYKLELAKRFVALGDTPRAEPSLSDSIDSLQGAISEVRRISRDLRPGILDDLGLGPALKTLTDDFADRTGIAASFQSVVFRNRLDEEAKIALYRIAQEALTNVERHAHATRLTLDLRGHRKGATLRITDNGKGLGTRTPGGLGLRNMEERVEKLGGTLRILSARGTGQSGTIIEATVPLTHLLGPETSTSTEPVRAAE